MKIQKKNIFFGGGPEGGGRVGGGGEVKVCERRIEFFCEISKTNLGGGVSGGGGRVGGGGAGWM